MAMGRNMRNLQDLKAMRGGSEGEEGGLIQSGPAVSTAAPASSQSQPYVQHPGGLASGVQGRPGVYQGMPQGASGTPQQQPPQQQAHSGSVPQGQVSSTGANQGAGAPVQAGTGRAPQAVGPRVPPGPTPRRLSESARLESLMREVDPNFRLSAQASEVVLHLVETFMTKVAERAAQVARHRSGSGIEQRDVAFVLLKDWNMALPPLPTPAQTTDPTKVGMKRKQG